jgi:hypothetical protein
MNFVALKMLVGDRDLCSRLKTATVQPAYTADEFRRLSATYVVNQQADVYIAVSADAPTTRLL